MPVWFFVLTLFIIGFILVFIEVVIIPGFGAAGILGFASIAVACYTAFTSLSPVIGILVSVGSMVAVIILFKLFPKTAAWRKIRLSISENAQNGFQVASPELKELLNKQGISLTMLRPSGTALIEGKHYDVITCGEFIEKDSKIFVYKIDGAKILVRKPNEDGTYGAERT